MALLDFHVSINMLSNNLNSCSSFGFELFCLQIWRQLFSPLHCLNFGVGGDATQHVLWRLSNGELDNISPKVQNIAKYREHEHACLFTQKIDCAWLCAKIQIPGTLTPNYQWHVLRHSVPSLFVAAGCGVVGWHEQSRPHSWTDLWWYHGYRPGHQEQAPPRSHACACRFFAMHSLKEVIIDSTACWLKIENEVHTTIKLHSDVIPFSSISAF